MVDALEDFEGTMIFGSHDRMFVRGLGSRVLELGGDSSTDRNPTVYPGSSLSTCRSSVMRRLGPIRRLEAHEGLTESGARRFQNMIHFGGICSRAIRWSSRLSSWSLRVSCPGASAATSPRKEVTRFLKDSSCRTNCFSSGLSICLK